MRSVVDRNVVMRRIPVCIYIYIYAHIILFEADLTGPGEMECDQNGQHFPTQKVIITVHLSITTQEEHKNLRSLQEIAGTRSEQIRRRISMFGISTFRDNPF
jgi:hypothetical protein